VVIVILSVSLQFFQFSYFALAAARSSDVIFSYSPSDFTSSISPIFSIAKGESGIISKSTRSQL